MSLTEKLSSWLDSWDSFDEQAASVAKRLFGKLMEEDQIRARTFCLEEEIDDIGVLHQFKHLGAFIVINHHILFVFESDIAAEINKEDVSRCVSDLLSFPIEENGVWYFVDRVITLRYKDEDLARTKICTIIEDCMYS